MIHLGLPVQEIEYLEPAKTSLSLILRVWGAATVSFHPRSCTSCGCSVRHDWLSRFDKENRSKACLEVDLIHRDKLLSFPEVLDEQEAHPRRSIGPHSEKYHGKAVESSSRAVWLRAR